jgi:hypothetical protein
MKFATEDRDRERDPDIEDLEYYYRIIYNRGIDEE